MIIFKLYNRLEMLYNNYITNKYENMISKRKKELFYWYKEAQKEKNQIIISPLKIVDVDINPHHNLEGAYLYENNGILYMRFVFGGPSVHGFCQNIIGISDIDAFCKYHNLDDETKSLMELYLQVNENQITVYDLYKRFSLTKKF